MRSSRARWRSTTWARGEGFQDADMDWQSSIDIVLRRFAEYHDLEGAFGRQ
jgi:hypothetical protein